MSNSFVCSLLPGGREAQFANGPLARSAQFSSYRRHLVLNLRPRGLYFVNFIIFFLREPVIPEIILILYIFFLLILSIYFFKFYIRPTRTVRRVVAIRLGFIHRHTHEYTNKLIAVIRVSRLPAFT